LLSVLAGNLSLHRFDLELNTGECTTVRYLDDFAIFGPGLDAVSDAFLRAQDELARLGMTCYVPDDGSHKGFKGLTVDGFDFLGCRIHPDGISPGRTAKRRFLTDVARAIHDAKARMYAVAADGSPRRAEPMYVQTLVLIDKKVRGWGDAYRFVTNRVAFAQLDASLNRMLAEFRRWYSRHVSEADARTGRRLSGVALLRDTPPKSRGPQ
jgi:RNA-directed DNA polymerase